MKINKYLKALGLEQYDLPGYYDEELEKNEKLSDKQGADIRNKEDEEGFCEYEFFSLDRTISLYIYSKLCYFKEYIPKGTPGSLCSFNTYQLNKREQNKARKERAKTWEQILDKMIEAFRLKIVGPRKGYEGVDSEKIRDGMQLFIDYFDDLWF